MPPADATTVRATLAPPRRRLWPWVALGIPLVGGLVWVALPGGSSELAPYELGLVERGTLTVDVTAVGKLQPVDEVSIGSELSGIVRHVYVRANDPVRAGQVLAELDSQVLEAQARQTHAAVDAAAATLQQGRVNVRAAKREIDRAEGLAARGAISAVALEQARTSWEVSVAALALAEAQLRQVQATDAAAQTNLEKTRIVTPIDGVVLERNVEPGVAVVSALQAATLFRVARDLQEMKVEVEVDEADVGRIEPGQRADFTVAAHRDRVFDAQVVDVGLAPLTSSEVVVYGAELRVANPDLELRPGMTATASIATETLQDVLLVPNAALRFQPEDVDLGPPEPREGRRVGRVWTWSGSELTPVEVLPLSSDGRRTAIESGVLDDGSEVVVGTRKPR